MSVVGSLDRADRRLLARLNACGVMDASEVSDRIARLKDHSLVEETTFGTVVITARGQLELARWRYRHLPGPSRVIRLRNKPQPRIWDKLFS